MKHESKDWRAHCPFRPLFQAMGAPLFGLLIAISLASCSSAPAAVGGDSLASDSSADVGAKPAAVAGNQTGIALFRRLAADRPAENLMLSPYAIEGALVLAYAGADGATRTEMGRVLHLPEDDQQVRASFAKLSATLNDMTRGSEGNIELHLANRLYGQRGFVFRDSFLSLLSEGYNAPFEPLDFAGDAARTRSKVNEWVSNQTNHKIHDLIPESGVGAQTKLMLVNALYLKAPWSKPFDDGTTTARSFYAGGTRAVSVPTMERAMDLSYRKGADFAALTLPYVGNDLQFVILLPTSRDGLGALSANLTPELLRPAAGASRLIRLYLPKFRLESSTLSLGHELQAMGMNAAFDQPQGSADFSRAALRQSDAYLALSEILHRTFIAVDEAGTEAAAGSFATLNSFGVSQNPPVPLEIHVDHPFIFAIQERHSGAILFLGSIIDPR